MRSTLSVDCVPVRDLGLHRASDAEIFESARNASVIIMTKDADLVRMVDQRGAPPQVILVTCGNTSNARLRSVIEAAWSSIRPMLDGGEPLVEIGERERR